MMANRYTPGLSLVLLVVLSSLAGSAPPDFSLAPGVALEAEDFHIAAGWKVIQNGQGNYMVDIIGFNHISGERLLGLDAHTGEQASAHHDVQIPETGKYRLWVRYEYPAFCETRFRIRIEQGGKTRFTQVAGTRKSPRFGFGDPVAKAQHDPAWGPEGLFCEACTTPELTRGAARIYLEGVAQPATPGVSAHRNIDLIYLTRDLDDSWMEHYRQRTRLYPILDAFRDTRGPRWEVRLTNRGSKASTFSIVHVYNRIPWGLSEPAVRGVAPGATSSWVKLAGQDTAHFGLTRFRNSAGPLEVEVRPVGGAVVRKFKGADTVRVYLPPYPGKGDKPITPEEEIDAVLTLLARAPAVGKKPTLPLCYGGWMPLGQDNAYGRKYAQLYAALGFRSLHPALSGPAVLKNLKAVGIEPTRSWAVMSYRNPPLPANIARAQVVVRRPDGLGKYLLWYDYGDEIHFSEWLRYLIQEKISAAKKEGKRLKPEQVMAGLWVAWLRAHRPKAKVSDYWRAKWGPFNLRGLRPDSSAECAAQNPRLYVDSLIFYEDTAIAFVARGAQAVREALGDHVLCGANYSCHPFYYPHTTTYIKWFRKGAAELGRHSEYFWQVGQAGPMINGYIAEHFRAGMRNNPRAVLRQYTMPHVPGNTDASFLRSAFSHLAHGAKALDFFGIGMNETFTENHIDHRHHHRYRAIRDVTHAVGLVEDLLPASRALPSPVALLVSESTERWDWAGIARDRAGHDLFGANFRKTRLHFHLERLGLWEGCTFQGVSPDLLIEEDIEPKILKDYRVLVLVGDCLPPQLAPVVENWVRQGGVVLATANAGRYDPYRQETSAFTRLFGLEKRHTEERATFLRPRQELPYLKPLDNVILNREEGKGEKSTVKMPGLATFERISPAEDVKVRGKFERDDQPAVLERRLGKGRLFYVASLPGLAYLWSALQPPLVPDRGPHTHSVPTRFDPGASYLLKQVLRAAEVQPLIDTEPRLIDARILEAPGGYIVPLANYNAEVGQKVTLKLAIPSKITQVTSAYQGELPCEQDKGRVIVTLPALGHGDLLRLDVKR
jgi:hypothetical protein